MLLNENMLNEKVLKEKGILPVEFDGKSYFKFFINTSYGGWRLSPRDLKAFLDFKYGKKYADNTFAFYIKKRIPVLNSYKMDTLLLRMSPKSVKNCSDFYFEYCVSVNHNVEMDLLDGAFYSNETYLEPVSFIGSRFDSDFVSFIESYGIYGEKLTNLLKSKGSLITKDDLYLYNYKVITVPSDVSFYIDEYDGCESVKEVARRWD